MMRNISNEHLHRMHVHLKNFWTLCR